MTQVQGSTADAGLTGGQYDQWSAGGLAGLQAGPTEVAAQLVFLLLLLLLLLWLLWLGQNPLCLPLLALETAGKRARTSGGGWHESGLDCCWCMPQHCQQEALHFGRRGELPAG